MDSWSLIIALVGVVALSLQGGSCLLTENRPFSLGVLNVLLAGVVGFVALSLYSGQMVLASEWGIVMIQGTWPSRCLRIALIAAAILPPLCLHRVRSLNQWTSHLTLALGVGLAVGAWAATRVSVLNVTDPDSHQVYLYDIWWPPLIVWFGLCFAGCVLALIKVAPTAALIAFSAALVTPLASFALRFEDLSDSQSRPGWLALERIGIVTATLILVYAFAEDVGRGASRRRRALLYAVGVAIAVGLWLWLGMISARSRAILGLLPLLPFGAALVLAIVDEITSKQESTTAAEPALASSRARPLRSLRQIIPITRLSGIVHSLALPLIALCLVDLFSIGYVNRGLELLVVLFLWLFFAEHIAEGALDDLPSLVKDGVLQTAAIKYLWRIGVRSLAAGRRLAASGLGFFAQGNRWQRGLKLLAIPVLTVFMLTAINEAMNYDKTVIQPFRWTEGSELKEEAMKSEANERARALRSSKEDVPKAFSEGVINALGRMRQDLRTDLILAQRNSSGEHPADVRQLGAGAEANPLDTAVAKSDELKFGNVSVPMTFFVSPLQRFIRSWFAIRSINGRLRRSAHGQYIVWVDSSYGESWRQTSGDPGADAGGPKADQEADPRGATAGNAGAVPTEKVCDEAEPEDHLEPIDGLIEKVAFDVARTDRSFIAAGMTDSWLAFQYLRRGLRHWDRHEREQGSAELDRAVGCFGAAVREDRRFVLAYYRLGVALREEGMPEAAIQVFRESRAVNPEFVPAALKEADTLDDISGYYPGHPAAPMPLPPGDRPLEAKRILLGLTVQPERRLSLSERQTAYYGLCISELEVAERGTDSAGLLPYYYCSRAMALSHRLSAAERLRLGEKQMDARILNTLGVALEIHRKEQRRDLLAGGREVPWMCRAKAFGDEGPRENGSVLKVEAWGNARSRAALDYYRRSLDLMPDDEVVRCNAAITRAFLYGDMEPMKRLMREAGPHISMGDEMQGLAHQAAVDSTTETDSEQQDLKRRATGYYRRARDEYGSAIAVDRTSVDALIDYALNVWQWEVDWLADRTSAPPDLTLALQGEAYAREALRLGRLRQAPRMEMLAREALGEVLLAQARTEEAVEQLSEAVTRQWSGLNETRWDLAIAELCTGGASRGPDSRAHFETAMDLLGKIRRSEEELEERPFSVDPPTLDALDLQARCPSGWGTASEKEFPYTMREASYERGPACKWSGVVASVNDDGPLNEYSLHVWGGGVDERITVGREPTTSVQLDAREKSTSAYYFAQLEGKDGHPVSLVRPFGTHGTSEKDACDHNLARLIFDRSSVRLRNKG
jgi:tetratricopeptide (TPR) repeat protein